jgi:hypothetical protein
MAVLRWLLLALAVAALSGCSAPGNGLYAPLPQTPTAWNGADHPARVRTEGQVIRSARVLHPKTEAIVGSIGYKSPDPALKPYSKEWFAQQEAIDREADAALVKKMTICRGCQSPPKESDLVAQPRTNSAQIPPKENEATGSTRSNRTVTDGANATIARPTLSSSPSTVQVVKKPNDGARGTGGVE